VTLGKPEERQESRLGEAMWKSMKRQVLELLQKGFHKDSALPLTHQVTSQAKEMLPSDANSRAVEINDLLVDKLLI